VAAILDKSKVSYTQFDLIMFIGKNNSNHCNEYIVIFVRIQNTGRVDALRRMSSDTQNW